MQRYALSTLVLSILTIELFLSSLPSATAEDCRMIFGYTSGCGRLYEAVTEFFPYCSSNAGCLATNEIIEEARCSGEYGDSVIQLKIETQSGCDDLATQSYFARLICAAKWPKCDYYTGEITGRQCYWSFVQMLSAPSCVDPWFVEYFATDFLEDALVNSTAPDCVELLDVGSDYCCDVSNGAYCDSPDDSDVDAGARPGVLLGTMFGVAAVVNTLFALL